jgi:integrase/recombinase XerD
MDDIDVLRSSFLAAYAGRTREAYATDLGQWLTWLDEAGVPPLEAKRRHVKTWQSQLTDLGRAPGTICRKLSAVSGFYASCVADDALDANPCTGVRRPKVSQESTRAGLDKDEWRRLRSAASAAGVAQLALVLLLGLNGLRISEACHIRLKDLREQGGRVVIEVLGKGNKIALVPLAPVTAAAVATLVAATSPHAGDELLPYDRHQGKRLIVALAAAAGITGKRITPHSLRHTFVTLSLEAGVKLEDVQDSARHADPRTTQRYNRARNNLANNATFRLSDYVKLVNPAA